MTLATTLDYPIIAVGDLHGRAAWLAKLVARLERLPEWPAARLVFLGDLGDRCDTVRAAVELVRRLLADKPGSTCVMGNHDLKLARVLAGQARMEPVVRATIEQLDEDMRQRVQSGFATQSVRLQDHGRTTSLCESDSDPGGLLCGLLRCVDFDVILAASGSIKAPARRQAAASLAFMVRPVLYG